MEPSASDRAALQLRSVRYNRRAESRGASVTTIPTPGWESAPRRDLLERYARLAIRVGINLEPGREVAIRAMIEHAPLVRALVKAGYEAGARRVEVEYEDLEVLRSQIALAPDEAVGTAPRWMFERLDDVMEQRRAQVFVIGFPPDMLGALDPARVARFFPTPAALRGAIRKLHDSKARPWTAIACATPSWAEQVYGEPDPERLWQALASVCRLDEPDPVAAWETHIDKLEARAALLNERRFDAIRFRGPGTDLTIGLLPQSRWYGAASRTNLGRRYVPNLPTDEVYTSPDRRRADGVARTTRPVALANGTIVRDLRLVFRDGAIVDATAARGEAEVCAELDAYAGARHLGEIALVDHRSRVGELDTLFYNLLLDENAACHIAYGASILGAYEDLPDGLSDDELRDIGVNRAHVHTDLMIGSDEVEVDGLTATGDPVSLLSGGDWQLS
jgi:aminopeptidase